MSTLGGNGTLVQEFDSADYLDRLTNEVRTSTQTVLGVMELLVESGLRTEQKAYADVVRSAVDRLSRISSEIRDLAMGDSSNAVIRRQTVDLDEFLGETVALLGILASEKGIHLSAHKEANVPCVVSTDRDRLEQVLLILLCNAIQFTERGSITIKVRVAGASTLEFVVTDTGRGILTERIPSLFDASRPGESSDGFGLRVARQILSPLGCSMSCDSELGKGSSFKFTIPWHEPLHG